MAIADGEVPGSDTEGCRLVVASYEAAAPLVSAAAADAARRIMMDPALGDFMDLRFVDMGPRPEAPKDRSAAARLILEEMLAPGDESGRNYFAIAVADRSAAEVELVLTECVNAPFLNTVPLRVHGIASRDDRRSASDAVSSAPIAIAASGAWSHSDLVDELRRHANELLGLFAAGQQGLSHGQLDSLRASYEQYVMLGQGEETSEDPGEAVPDELSAEPVPAAQLDILAAESPPPAALPAAPAQTDTAVTSTAEAGTAAPSPVPEQPVSAPASPLGHLPRWLADPPWRRGKQPVPDAGAQAEGPRIPGLAYLLIIGDQIADDPVSWQRSRASLLRLDAKIATIPRAAYLVRTLQGDAEALRSELREAGQLGKKEVRQPVADADFAEVLEEMRALLRRDLARPTATGEPLARPVVVFFAPDPPLADSIAADAFGRLAREALIVWVVPKEAMELLSDAFTEPSDVYVLAEHEDVADEVAELLTPPGSPAVTPADTLPTENGVPGDGDA